MTSIGDIAFQECTALTSITFPNSLTSIGNAAFQKCTALASITFSNSLRNIGTGAFSSCSSLKLINIPKSMTSIGMGAFSSCSSLKSIIIPSSVKTIYDYTFSGCTGIESIVYKGKYDPGASSSSVFSVKDIIVKVPSTYRNETFCGLSNLILGQFETIQYNQRSARKLFVMLSLLILLLQCS